MIRIGVAGLLGGLIMFFWGAAAHMGLKLGDIGFRYGSPGTAVLQAMAAEQPSDAASTIHMLPSLPEDQMGDAAAVERFAKDASGKPYALVVYAPGGNPASVDMGATLGIQLLTDCAAALLLAWVLSLVTGFSKRVLVAAAAGVFAALAIQMPLSNWYLFPLGYSLGIAAKHLMGWSLAGAVMAWWLARGDAKNH